MSGWDREVNRDGDTLADLAATRLGRIADALERLADRYAPTPEQHQEIRDELAAAIIDEFRYGRYRNIGFDGMDTRFTSVIPQRSVELAIERVFKRRSGSVILPTHPAIGEKDREDIG